MRLVLARINKLCVLLTQGDEPVIEVVLQAMQLGLPSSTRVVLTESASEKSVATTSWHTVTRLSPQVAPRHATNAGGTRASQRF